MKRLLILCILCLVTWAFGQNFQGKILYDNTYESKIAGMPSAQLSEMMGSTLVYEIHEGNYRTDANGSFLQWQLYRNEDNKLYTKTVASENIFWTDAAVNPDKILKVQVNKNAATILGYECDEVILTCESGVEKYYFNAALAVDPSLFTGHLFGNWYDYVKVARALPLKYIIEKEQFTVTSTATAVEAMEIDDSEFQLPSGATTAPSPF